MKKILPFLFSVLLIVLFSCNNSTDSSHSEQKTLGQIVEISIPVGGMTCGGCENTVNTQLLKFEGVVESNASHIEKQVIVKVDTMITSINDMKSEIERVGYKVLK